MHLAITPASRLLQLRHGVIGTMLALAASLLLADAASARPLKLDQILQQDWQWQLRQRPELATEVGENRYNHLLSDVSPAAFSAAQKHEQKMLEALKRVPRHKLRGQEILSYDLFLYEKERNLRLAQIYPYQVYPLTQIGGIHVDIMQLVEKSPFATKRDYDNYLRRLQAVPRHVDGLIMQLQASMAQGWVAPKVSIAPLVQQLATLTQKLPESSLGTPMRQMPASFSAKQRRHYAQAIEQQLQTQVVPALAKLSKFLEQHYLPACRDSIAVSALPQGQAYYAELVALHTTTRLSPQEIHQIGLQEVERIQAQMLEVMKKTGFKGSFSQFVKKINQEPQFFYTNEEDLLQGYRDIITHTRKELPKLFARLPRTAVGVKPVPKVNAENQGGAYYEPSTPDGSRIGYFVANTSRLELRPKWKMETLTLHEAEPGHHFQIALTQEIPNLPAFRRFGWYTAYGEGWALYAESLGFELGLYRDPYSHFGHLDDEIYRAARLVVDTGIHALGWSRQQAIDYLNQHTANPPADNEIEVDRYIVWPGQALGYKIGQIKLLQLRQQAQHVLGDKFDIRAFHDVVLGNGGLPLDMIENAVLQWQQKILSSQKP